jgi:hypothetical protein
MIVPNAIGVILSAFNLSVKACVNSKWTQEEGIVAPYSLTEVLRDLTHGSRKVFLQSVSKNMQIYTPIVDGCQSEEVHVGTALAGVELQICSMPENCVAFKLPDERMLCVTRSTCKSRRISTYSPSPFSVVAKRCDTLGEDAAFLPISTDGIGWSSDEVSLIAYAEGTVSFWNPLHQVFMRINDHLQVDCSPQIGLVNGMLRLPAGFHWERFSIIPAEGGQPPHIIGCPAESTMDSATA